jgi:hypothetical protein
MTRERSAGYRAVHGAIALQTLDQGPADEIAGLAEALLLARRRADASDTVDRISVALTLLVDHGDLSRPAADRFWALLRACGPPMSWPSSWESSTQ